MKTLALTIAATMIASSSAFAGGLFDVDDAPTNFDNSATISMSTGASVATSGNYMPLDNANLFDVDEFTNNKEGNLDLEATASIGSGSPVVDSGNYMPFNNNDLFDVSDR